MTHWKACNTTEQRVAAVELGLDHGFAFTPLRGKRPILKGWVHAPIPSREEVMKWTHEGNVGLRTGAPSNVVVIDADDGADIEVLDLPPTVELITGGNGRHIYFLAPDYPTKNSSGLIAPHVDFKGDRGQTSYVFSVHPDTGAVYRWADGRALGEIPIAPLPEHLEQYVRRRIARPNGRPSDTPRTTARPSSYGRAALEAEIARVREAEPGHRNDTLNSASFSISQLCAGGHISEEEARALLLGATDLDDAEARRTIESAFRAGFREPRGPSGPMDNQTPRTSKDESDGILIPGQHIDDHGCVIEVSTHDFAADVLTELPPGTLYRRGGVPGELLGVPGEQRFEVCNLDRGRLKIDERARLLKWGGRKTRELQYVACTKNHAGLVLAAAVKNRRVRDLELVVPYPAIGCQPGWNESGIYFDPNDTVRHVQPILDREVIDATLTDILVDFPFRDEASRQNVIGLLLTPLLRPTIKGNVPFHLITSPMERTGKTLLVEAVVGGILLGRPTPALQFCTKEEEQEKRITSLLLQSDTIVHLDNLRDTLDSAPLASLLTSRVWQGRLLGINRMVTLPNHSVLIGTGNNVRMTSELAKRSVPIILQPQSDVPEERTGFVHADISGYVLERRQQALSCLLGMVNLWKQAGSPAGTTCLGGFDTWAKVVGGVMTSMGYTDWLANRKRWLRDADPEGNDLTDLISAWLDRYGNDPVPASKLLELADGRELFQDTISGRDATQRVASFSRAVLSHHKDRPVGGYMMRHKRTQAGGRWFLHVGTSGVDVP